MPVETILKYCDTNNSIGREKTQEILLSDNMSSNWLKEPLGKDFTAIML
jgi:hypothetical protein